MILKLLNSQDQSRVAWFMTTIYLRNYTEQSPISEVDSRSTSQEIPCLLWNPEVHYCVYINPPVVANHSQVTPVQFLTTYFYKIHSNIILLSILLSLPFGFSDYNYVCIYLFHACCMPRLSHPWFVDHPNNVAKSTQ